jgi:hypothetical protein
MYVMCGYGVCVCELCDPNLGAHSVAFDRLVADFGSNVRPIPNPPSAAV